MKTKTQKNRERAVIGADNWHYDNKPSNIFIDVRSYLKKKPVKDKKLCITTDYIRYPECIPYHIKEEDWSFAANPTEEINSLELEMTLYEAKKEIYLNDYEGKYIALQNQEVLDSDADFSELAKRVYEKNGYKPVFIPLVTRSNSFKAISPKSKYYKLP